MRTKTLLVAAAALAAAVTSSQAQTVYSQNIVGYVNSVLPANSYSMLVAPLQGTNTAADILMPCLQAGDTILTWTGSGYNANSYIGGGPSTPGGTGPGNWFDGVNVTNPPTLAPGQGFFYQTASGSLETNTFTGQCVLSNSVALAAGLYYQVGSTPPVAGAADDTNTINLPLNAGDTVLVWTGNGYYADSYIGSGPSTPGGSGPGNWFDGVNVTNPPVVSVGQGFFYQTAGGVPETWQQNIVVQP